MILNCLIEAVNIGRKSGDGSWLLRELSLSVSAGERWAITGPTGAGKTLFLRALALLDPLDEGTILFNGNPIANEDVPAYRRKAIYLHQRPVLIEGSVEENLRLAYSFHGCREEDFDRGSILGSLQLLSREASFLDQRSGDLSGGEAQLVALLRAIQLNPSVLLLDEPTAALDAQSVELIESLIDRWMQSPGENRATVWVTHDAAQAARVADRVLRLESGRVRE